MELNQKMLQKKLKNNFFNQNHQIRMNIVQVIREYTKNKIKFSQQNKIFSFKLKKNHQVIQSLVLSRKN